MPSSHEPIQFLLILNYMHFLDVLLIMLMAMLSLKLLGYISLCSYHKVQIMIYKALYA